MGRCRSPSSNSRKARRRPKRAGQTKAKSSATSKWRCSRAAEIDLATGEQAEDHEQRVEAERAPHHLRNDDVSLELCGGEASHVVRAGTPPSAPRVIAYDPALTQKLGGVQVDEAEQRRILALIDAPSTATSGCSYYNRVTACRPLPMWR